MNNQFKEKDKIARIIRKNVVGARCQYSTPFGKREMVYADYTASGRCLKFVEDYMIDVVRPMYANTHTEASMTGAQTTRLREEARDIIGKSVNAPKKEYAVLFTGTGSTGAIDKLVRVLGFDLSIYSKKSGLRRHIPENGRPVVFVSHLEHHSNELIWRHSIARCVVIDEDANGFPDLIHLERELRRLKRHGAPLIGSFSAGSNVTGIQTPVRAITKMLHRYGAYAFFDYAGVGAYVEIDMQGNGTDDAMDAIFLSPHKFIGGPGAAGVLVARRNLFESPFGVHSDRPTLPGGGTVAFVSEHGQVYANDIESREDAGTPGILQCIQAGLVFKVKEMVGSRAIHELEKRHGATAIKAWNRSSFISLMGSDRNGYFDMDNRVSIISFNILSPVVASFSRTYGKLASQMVTKCNTLTNTKQKESQRFLPLHFNFVVALLNDLYGIQARGGCSCAGPYAQRLFGTGGESGREIVDHMEYLALKGVSRSFNAGWARLNFNYFISKDEAAFIVEAVNQIAVHGWKLLPHYIQNVHSGQFFHRTKKLPCAYSLSSAFDGIVLNEGLKHDVPICKTGDRSKNSYNQVLKSAMKIYNRAVKDISSSTSSVTDFNVKKFPEGVDQNEIWWLRPSEAAAELARQRKKTVLWSKGNIIPPLRKHPPIHDTLNTMSSELDCSTSSKSSSEVEPLDNMTGLSIPCFDEEIEC